MTRRTFTDALPPRILFDTSFLIHLVIASQTHHDACVAFFDRVVKRKPDVVCFVSALAYAEFANASARLFLIADVGLTPEQAQEELRTTGPGAVATQVAAALDALENTLSYPEEMYQVPLDTDRWLQALDVLMQHSLQPYDAIHAAAALHARCADIASFDGSFDRVPMLNRWTL